MSDYEGSFTAEEFDKLMWEYFKPRPVVEKRIMIVNLAMSLFFHFLKVLNFVENTPELLGTLGIWDNFY